MSKWTSAFRGFPAIGTLTHRRRATLALTVAGAIRRLDVIDEITGDGARAAQSLVHLHPDITPQISGARVELWRDGHRIGRLSCADCDHISVTDGWYCPEFGSKQRNAVLQLSLRSALPARLAYTIELNEPDGGDPIET